MPNSPERADRLHEFFDLQLLFAAFMAERMEAPLRHTVTHYTNLYRRFGLGDPGDTYPPMWEEYLAGLDPLAPRAEQLAWTRERFLLADELKPPAHHHLFGCFACEPVGPDGIVRIHFGNRDRDGVSPLHRSKSELRRKDLTALVGFAMENYPWATSVMGTSWLYNLEAYRRLFPPEYGASAHPAERLRLIGLSSWGQLLTHDEFLKPAMRDILLQNLDRIDLAAPWRIFPLPALAVSAPLEAFRRFYGV